MFVKKFSDTLNEVILHPEYKDVENNDIYILAYKKYIYMVGDGDSDNLSKILNSLNLDDVDYSLSDDDFYQMISELESVLDLLIFRYKKDDDTIVLDVKNEFTQDANSSKQFIDVLKTLKIELNIKYLEIAEEIGDFEYDNTEFSSDILHIDDLIKNWENDIKYRKLPNIVYHGTCLKYAESICKIGLIPTETSNYKEIKTPNRLFFTSVLKNAIFHANKAAYNTETPPMIIRIDTAGMDINKIDFDYDFYIDYVYSQEHDDMHDYEKTSPRKLEGIKNLSYLKNKYIGSTYRKFAYIGRISPKFILGFNYNLKSDNIDFSEECDKEFIPHLIEIKDLYDEYGYEFHNKTYSFDEYEYNEMKEEFEQQQMEEDEENYESENENKKIILFDTYVKRNKNK